ncbi:hypothetical protein C0Q70_02672 [Pomacea canaliculata]|uniref:Uncharacterized protein n=1 Tax=Pomacea canaliculata TaxID=400727 RepID=A0A2T7PQL0_POMCA|nr:hypothetical protein C0Q70_02672 [Pomacea canaliculata]
MSDVTYLKKGWAAYFGYSYRLSGKLHSERGKAVSTLLCGSHIHSQVQKSCQEEVDRSKKRIYSFILGKA